jgi:predicted transglutaminase-like cysteine proteinase
MLPPHRSARRLSGMRRAAAVALMLAGLVPFADSRAVAANHVFGAPETFSTSLANFPKWRGVVQRFTDELASCPASRCDKATWKKFLDSLRGYDTTTQTRTVHKRLNDRRYILDIVNWGVNDYWATPFEFMRKNGDCEDYAIGKYMVLKALGMPIEQMRIVVLMDLNLGILHAVLLVDLDGETWLLDNQIRSVVPAATVRHYQPYYSLNETGWWFHQSS